MGMRSIGTLNIHFGLMVISVSVNSFLDYQGITFKQLCPNCKSPISEVKVCKNCEQQLQHSQLLSGFQVSKDNIIIIDKEQLKPDLTPRIIAIINSGTAPDFLSHKHYLLTPKPNFEKQYWLLFNLLTNENKEIVIEYALKKRLYLGIVKPINLGENKLYLLLKQILYYDNIKDIPHTKPTQIAETEHTLALELFRKMCEQLKGINFSEIKDKRKEILEKMLTGKMPITTPEEKIGDLVEQLKESIKQFEKKKKKVSI
jgi:non-homologous end joining protein Ku